MGVPSDGQLPLDAKPLDVELRLTRQGFFSPILNLFGANLPAHLTVLQEMQLGVSRVESLRHLADRTDVEELRAFVLAMVQALLGMYPYAPLNLLLVDPQLPDWLPELTVSGLRVGKAVAQIRFFRKPDGVSDYQVLDVQGTLHVVRQPRPWSLTAGVGERFSDLLTSLVPGR